MDVFRERRRAGKTLVLVTHDMGTVQQFCDRAMLIHDGELRYLGDPEEAALAYYRLNFGGGDERNGRSAGGVPDVNVRLVDVWLENESGQRIENIWQNEPIRFNLEVEANHEVEGPMFGFEVLNVDGFPILGFGDALDGEGGRPGRLAAGERARISATVENRLVPGRYSVNCSISKNNTPTDTLLRDVRLLDFLVRTTKENPAGMVNVHERLEVHAE
jgi:hypothetical protein